MNYFSKDDFKNEWLGKSSNLGNNYNQCVTLYKEFLKKAGYPDSGRAMVVVAVLEKSGTAELL